MNNKNSSKINIAFVALALSMGVIENANALEFDVGVGVNKYMKGENGLWYVEPFPYDMKMVSPALDIGVTQNILDRGNWGLDVRAGLVYLGSIHTTAKVPSYKTNTRTGSFIGPDFKGADLKNPCFGECTHMSTFDGSGSDRGITLVLAPYVKSGDWKYSIFGGLYQHKTTWSENIKDLNDSSTGEDYNLNVEYDQGWRAGRVYGVSVSRKNITVRYQFFDLPRIRVSNDRDAFPPAFGAAHLLTIGFKF